MAGIRFIINKDLQGRQDNAGARIARNIANTARQVGETTAISIVKQSVYDLLLLSSFMGGNGDNILSTSNDVSPYAASDNRFPSRNNLIFESNDKSFKVALWDIKIDTTFENTIVKTALTKRKGTVKEKITAKDYSFTLSGNLIADSQYYFPLIELQEFIKLFDIEENFNVSNVLMNTFGVHKVVLESASIPQSSAKYVNAIPFNLKLISDEDIDLTIVEEGT